MSRLIMWALIVVAVVLIGASFATLGTTLATNFSTLASAALLLALVLACAVD